MLPALWTQIRRGNGLTASMEYIQESVSLAGKPSVPDRVSYPRSNLQAMRPAVAIVELEKLKAEAAEPLTLRPPAARESWKGRVRGVMARSLGDKHDLVKRFDAVRYTPGAAWSGMPASVTENAFTRGVSSAVGLVDAAIYELGLIGGDEPVDEHAFDPELWAHVKQQVEDADWYKVASQTAIFVENHVRTWAGTPTDKAGNHLVGKALYLEVFGDASDYRLGRQAGEREGWRFLGMGFAQALGNVDRHRIQKRDDAKRYALGVLGLGSLLLTQLRHEHSDILKDGS